MADFSSGSLDLHPRTTPGAQVTQSEAGIWRLSIPAGPAGRYRLAQLDDYKRLPRRDFPWRPPLTLELRARASHNGLPGTWGFGFWNDPFATALGFQGSIHRLPAPPNTAWFFHASPPNYLSLRDDRPAAGFLTALFSAASIPPLAFLPALPFLPLLAWRPAARLLRRAARRLIREDAAALDIDVTAWHTYRLELQPGSAAFSVDGVFRFESTVSPRPPLGLVIWIDNQYAAFAPDGRLRYGALAASVDAWLEIAGISVSHD